MKLAQSCLTLCDPMSYTVHGILQARILQWVVISFARESSQPRDRTLQADSVPAQLPEKPLFCSGSAPQCLGRKHLSLLSNWGPHLSVLQSPPDWLQLIGPSLQAPPPHVPTMLRVGLYMVHSSSARPRSSCRPRAVCACSRCARSHWPRKPSSLPPRPPSSRRASCTAPSS